MTAGAGQASQLEEPLLCRDFTLISGAGRDRQVEGHHTADRTAFVKCARISHRPFLEHAHSLNQKTSRVGIPKKIQETGPDALISIQKARGRHNIAVPFICKDFTYEFVKCVLLLILPIYWPTE